MICVYDKDCSFKNVETLECSFDSTCNQQAEPYVLNGVTYMLRRSDLIMLTLTKTISETLLKNNRKVKPI